MALFDKFRQTTLLFMHKDDHSNGRDREILARISLFSLYSNPELIEENPNLIVLNVQRNWNIISIN